MFDLSFFSSEGRYWWWWGWTMGRWSCRYMFLLSFQIYGLESCLIITLNVLRQSKSRYYFYGIELERKFYRWNQKYVEKISGVETGNHSISVSTYFQHHHLHGTRLHDTLFLFLTKSFVSILRSECIKSTVSGTLGNPP